MNIPAVIGTLLGDAWIQRIIRGNNKYYSFNYQQKSKEYAERKANLIGIPFSSNTRTRF